MIADVEAKEQAAPETEAEPSKPIKPYWSDARRDLSVYQGDALELLAKLKPETFDLIFADPPYFLSSNGMTCQGGKWVSVNKGLWDKTVTFEEIHKFNLEWLGLCQRALKPNGAIWVSGTSHNIHSVGFALQTLGYKILNDIAWYKINPPPNLACRYFTHSVETLLWARKSPQARHTFNYKEMKAENGNKQMQSLWAIPSSEESETEEAEAEMEKNLWEILPPKKSEKRHGKHPTQKPEALLDRIIRSSSNKGDRILDPFMGSGTTGVVAARLGRGFVGIEQEGEYLDLAAIRMSEENQQLSITVLGGGGDTLNGTLRRSPFLTGARGTRFAPACRRLWCNGSHRRRIAYQQRLGGPCYRAALGTCSQFGPSPELRVVGTESRTGSQIAGWNLARQGNNGNYHD